MRGTIDFHKMRMSDRLVFCSAVEVVKLITEEI